MTPNQSKVLKSLFTAYVDYGHEFCYMPFRPIANDTGLTRREVCLACRALKRKGLAEFMRPLWTEDGDMVGAGYGITEKGIMEIEKMENQNDRR